MSLLQDALRKTQRIGGGSAPPSLPPLRGGSPAKRGTRWKRIAGVLAAAFTVGVAGVLFLTNRTALPPAISPPVPSSPRATPSVAAPVTPPSPPAVAVSSVAPSDASPASHVSGLAPVRHTSKDGSSRTRLPGTPVPHRTPAPPAPAAEVPAARLAAPSIAAADRNDPVLEKFNAGVAALNRGEAAESTRLLREATALSPRLVEGWNALGLSLLRQRRLEEADAAFSTVLSLSPRYPPGLLNAGLLRLEQGRVEEGAAYFSMAADLAPGALAPRVNLAVAQARMGRYGEAEETLLAAGHRFPGHPDVLYHLGTVYDRTGNREKAAEAYSAFLAASAGSRPPLEERVRERLRAWEVPAAK